MKRSRTFSRSMTSLLVTLITASATASLLPGSYPSPACAAEQTSAPPTTGAPVAEVGQAAPDFTLNDINGKPHSLSQYKGKYVVLEWINFDCPFVQKHYKSGNMQKLQETYTGKGVVWLSINSSAKGRGGNYPPEKINELLKQYHAHQTAYLTDEDGKVGHLYGAKATPHMFVIDKAGKLVYAGAIDDKNTADEADIKTAKNYVAEALDATMAGKPVVVTATKAYGCSVKYER